jgi:signal transduction histidine kinase
MTPWPTARHHNRDTIAMKLRQVTFIGIAALALIFLGIESYVTNSIIKNGFDRLENDLVASDIRRARNEVVREIDGLDTFLWDWSAWDDTYEYARNGSETYVESNLGGGTFDDQSLNLVIIADTHGRIIFGRALTRDGTESPALLNRMRRASLAPGLPPIKGDGTGAGGLTVLPEGVMLFARRPILNSAGQGPAAGSIVMGRLLDQDMIEAIASRLELPLEIHPVGPAPSPEIASLLKDLTVEDHLVKPRNGDIVDAYALLWDVDGKPGVIISVTEERSVSRQGRTVAKLNFLLVASVFIAFSLLMFFLLRRRVLSRVERLNAQVRELDHSTSETAAVTMDGNDEIAELAGDINAMLRQIDENRTRLQSAHDDLEETVVERTAELVKANRELLWLDQAKSHFLSSASHELRTPLTSILGFIKLMERTFRKRFRPLLGQEGSLGDHVATHEDNFRIIRMEAERLGRLINDLLDFSKLEAGKMVWQEEEVTIPELVRDATDVFSGQLDEQSGITLAVNVAQPMPILRVNKDRIHQVLMNLLTNAAKHTRRGFIKVDVRRERDAVLFSVEDSGSGIAPEDRERIFDVFYQARGGASQPSQSFGSGLGLAICKEIVEHYGGRIWVEPGPVRGSVFTFSLPLSLTVKI